MKNENFGAIFFGIFAGYIGWSNAKHDDPSSLQPWLAFSSLCQGDGEKDIVIKACSWTAACDSYSTEGKFDWRNGMRLDLTVNSIRYSHIF